MENIIFDMIPTNFDVSVSSFNAEEDVYYEYHLDINSENITYSFLSFDKTGSADATIRNLPFENILATFVEWHKTSFDSNSNIVNLKLEDLEFRLKSVTLHDRLPNRKRAECELA